MQTEFPMQTATVERTDSEQMHGRLPVQPDEELLATYAETGNRNAFEELVHRYERELYSYLRQCLGDAQWAEDAFQTTFLQVHLKCRQFAGPPPPTLALYDCRPSGGRSLAAESTPQSGQPQHHCG